MEAHSSAAVVGVYHHPRETIPPKPLAAVRIVCVSDTHSNHAAITRLIESVPSPDVLVHAGDLTLTGMPRELHEVSRWLQSPSLRALSRVVIAGNHDVTLDPPFYNRSFRRFHHEPMFPLVPSASVAPGHPGGPPLSDAAVFRPSADAVAAADAVTESIAQGPSGPPAAPPEPTPAGPAHVGGDGTGPSVSRPAFVPAEYPAVPHCTYMCHPPEAVLLRGLRVWGSPYSPEFCRWAFAYPREEETAAWAGMPAADIVVTHGPPFGVCDATSQGASVGCAGLRRRLHVVRPALMVCGHIHEAFGAAVLDHEALDTDRQPLTGEALLLATGPQPPVAGREYGRGRSTVVVNAASLNLHYRPHGGLVVVDMVPSEASPP
eukprot:TRINITY_DN47918_c0_g1_i1.p1 TRINITY_DN47918_c0_g1~~TRINITY_DN47918_c0_g1_i1.p1  ORF type:complete len:376 (-),score=47.47 TRINITY_DN47918_c0_g1_i1:318-1445(-)